MLVSVIIPTRNRTSYVRQLICDLKAQNMQDFEIIVVDQSSEPPILLDCNHVKTNTVGPCISRNLGVKQSSGEILVFLDDDARVESNFLEQITKPILSGKCEAVAGAMCDIDGNYPKEDGASYKVNTTNFIKAITNNPDSGKSQYTLSLPGACCAILKNIFLTLGGFDETFDPTGAGEDRDLALNLHVKGYAIWYNCEAKLMHIGASTGGSRDVGSRSEGLDINSYKICKKYFSPELANSLKRTLLNKYRKKVFVNLLKYKGSRSRILQYLRVRNQLT